MPVVANSPQPVQARSIKPAGALEPHEVFGRDNLIVDLWQLLHTSSVIIDAPRRMGKSSMLKKMAAEPPDDFIAAWIDLEVPQSAAEFYEAVYDHNKVSLNWWRRCASGVKHFAQHLSGAKGFGVEIPAFRPLHWTNLLDKHVGSILKSNPSKRIVWMLDELPLMLSKICKPNNFSEAAQILSTLRHLREKFGDRLRFVYSGSVGLHHITDMLEAQRIREPFTNTMELFKVPPLSPSSASALASELAQSAALNIDVNLCEAISRATDGIPFYIHHALRSMTRSGGTNWDKESLKVAFDKWLEDPTDPWKIRSDHFQRLISPDYYDGKTRALAMALLDLIAASPNAVDIATCHSRAIDLDRSHVNEFPQWCTDVLRLLCLDHYLEKQGNTYTFRYGYFQRWWQVNRSNYGGPL